MKLHEINAIAAAVRSLWKGRPRRSLATNPARLVSAARLSGAHAFHHIDRKTNPRICFQKVVPGIGEVEPGLWVLQANEEQEDEKQDALKPGGDRWGDVFILDQNFSSVTLVAAAVPASNAAAQRRRLGFSLAAMS